MSTLSLLLGIRLQGFANAFRVGDIKKRRRRWARALGFLIFPVFFFASINGTFRALSRIESPGAAIMESLISLAFSGLFVFLLFSGITMVMHFIFLAKDLPLLLTIPIYKRNLFQLKWIEASIANSTIYFAVAVPMIIAYGLAHHAGILFYIGVVPLSLVFILLPTGFAIILSLVIVRILPSRKAKNAASVFTALVFIALWIGFQMLRISGIDPTSANFSFERMLQFRAYRFDFLPSQWMADSLNGMATGQWLHALGQMGLLLVLGGTLYYISTILLESAYQKDMLMGSSGTLLFSGAKKSAVFASRSDLGSSWGPLWTLIQKDFRLLTRDSRHLTQVFIYAVIMIVFPFVIEKNEASIHGVWHSYYTYLFPMMFAALMSSTFSARLIPIEGMSFSYAKISPQPMWRLVLAKLVLSYTITMVAVSIAIVLISWNQKTPLLISARIFSLGSMICFGAAGLGIFFGAIFAKFDWEHPKRMLNATGHLFLSICSLIYMGANVVIYILLTGVMPFYSIGLLMAILSIIIVIIGTVMAHKKLQRLEWVF